MPPRGTRKLREIESEGKKGRERKNPEQIRANSREGYYWSLLLGSERRQLITDREVCSRELWQSLPVTRSFASKLRPSLPPPPLRLSLILFLSVLPFGKQESLRGIPDQLEPGGAVGAFLTRLVLLGDYGGAVPLQLSAELGDDGMQLGEPLLVPRGLLFRALLGAGRLHLRSHQRGLGRLPRARSRHQPRVQLGHFGPQRGERGRMQLRKERFISFIGSFLMSRDVFSLSRRAKYSL